MPFCDFPCCVLPSLQYNLSQTRSQNSFLGKEFRKAASGTSHICLQLSPLHLNTQLSRENTAALATCSSKHSPESCQAADRRVRTSLQEESSRVWGTGQNQLSLHWDGICTTWKNRNCVPRLVKSNVHVRGSAEINVLTQGKSTE